MMIIQGYNFFFLQISFLGHIIILDKYICQLFLQFLDKIVCVYEEMGERWSFQSN